MSCINNRAKEHYKFDQAKQHFFLRRPSWQRLSEGGATFYINIIHIELRYAKQHEFWYTSNGSLFQKPRRFSEKDWWHKPSTLMLSPRFIFIFTVFSLLSAFSFFSWQQPGLFSFPLRHLEMPESVIRPYFGQVWSTSMLCMVVLTHTNALNKRAWWQC